MPADSLWLTRVDAAALCGLSPRQFDEAIRPRVKDGERGAGKTLRLFGPKVVEALVAYRIEQAAPPGDDESDPLMKGGSSPALEEYRRVKTDLARIDLSERRVETVRAGVLRDAMKHAITALRGTGDRLARQFGNDAADLFNEGVGEFEAAALQAIGGSDEQRG